LFDPQLARGLGFSIVRRSSIKMAYDVYWHLLDGLEQSDHDGLAAAALVNQTDAVRRQLRGGI
jgi:hypothetical protein